MNSTSLLFPTPVFGFFELDSEGTVLYSRPVGDAEKTNGNQTIIGQDFFREVFSCQNIETFRRKFLDFVIGNQMTERFLFKCLAAETILLKIMFVKVLENNGAKNKKVIYVDIRQG
jgi:hypothetical protein